MKNTHYAIITETEQEDGTIKSTYSTPKKWPGAVSLSLDPSGESNTFYADDTAYAVLSSNSGYEGDFESALVPEEVETEVMGQEEVDGVLVESSTDEQKYIALLFEFSGDKKARRHVLYRCSLTRHSVASQTKEDSTEPVTESVTITAAPRPDVNVINGKEKIWLRQQPDQVQQMTCIRNGTQKSGSQHRQNKQRQQVNINHYEMGW